jgi:catecholate siderophore receptor
VTCGLLLATPALAQSNAANNSGPVMLGPVQVEDAASRNGQNHDLKLSTSPTTSVQDTPQAVTVIDSEIMKQQATTTLGDALRNVPGITIAIGEGGTLAGDQFKINGFDAKDDVYLDGLRDFAAYTRDSFDYDEVQVLKGPSGLMFGRGTTGGAINTVSKTPFLGEKYVVQGEVGNGNHYRGTADLNYQLSDTAAVRLNLMEMDTGVVDRDLTHSTRFGIAPSLALGLGTDTTFFLNFLHQQTAARPDYGLVVASPPNSVFAKPVSEFGVPRNTYMGFKADHDKNTADLVTAKLTHVATDWLTLENDARVAVYGRDFRYTSSDACDNTIAKLVSGVETTGTNYCNLRIFGIAQPGAAAGSFDPTQTLLRTGGSGPYTQSSWGMQDIASATANFHIGGFRNETIVGFDAAYQRADRTIYAYTLPDPATYTYQLSPPGTNLPSRADIGFPLFGFNHQTPAGYNVILPTAANYLPSVSNPGGTSAVATTVVTSSGEATDPALFATDRFWFTDDLSLIAGLRVDQYRANYRSVTVAGVYTQFKSPSFLFDPRASLVYEPDETQTYYLSWAKAAVPIGTSVVGSPTPISSAASSALKPDKSENLELGAKFALFDGKLGLSGSVFNETKSNALQVDPATGDVQLQSSQKQRVQGFAGSAAGEVLPHFSLLASYTYLNPIIVSDNSVCAGTPAVCVPNPATVGKQITFVPKHAVSMWGNYEAKELLEGLSFGGGLIYQSHLFNAYTAPTVQPVGTPVPVGYPLGRVVEIPETVELDAVVAYEIDRLRFQVNINNLADRLYYAQTFGNRATPAAGRTVIFSVGADL